MQYHNFGNKMESFLFLMETFEKVDNFDVSKEEWAQYEEHLSGLTIYLVNDINTVVLRKELYSCVCYWSYT